MVYTSGPQSERFIATNLGTIVSALNSLGHQAQQVALAPSTGLAGTEVDGVRLESYENLCDPGWWKRQDPWAVITNTWGAPRFAPIHRAIQAATPRHLDRLDTDGIRSSHVDFPLYIHHVFSRLRDARYAWKRMLAPFLTVGMTAAHRLFPAILEKKQAATIASLPLVTAESPISVERMRRLQRFHVFPDTNIFLSPFPVSERDSVSSVSNRQNSVISVGRWAAHQKNFPLLLRTLESFLSDRPDWSAEIIGSLPGEIERLKFKHAPSVNSHPLFRTTRQQDSA